MIARILITAGLLTALAAPGPASAQASGSVSPLSLGTAIGKALFILLALLVGLSVLAKLSIVFGFVPREPNTPFQTLVHRAANFVGRIRPSRSISDRRRANRFSDDRES